MDIEIFYIHRDATHFEVVKAIEEALHGRDLFDRDDPKTKGRPHNFQIRLNANTAGGIGNDGTGVLTVAPREVGSKFLQWLREDKSHIVRVLEKKMYFARLEQPPYKDIAQTLERSVYVGPEKQLEREEILRKLDQVLRVAKVQFGIWFKEDDLPDTARSFSIEYERDLVKSSAGLLDLVYDRKMVRIEVILFPFGPWLVTCAHN